MGNCWSIGKCNI